MRQVADRLRLWLAGLLIDPRRIAMPGESIIATEDLEGLFLFAAHRDADARLELEGGDDFDVHFDRTAN